MEDRTIFVLQILWFLLAWSCIARLVLWPWSRTLEGNSRIAVWIAPQMFRVLGLGLLVPALAPGMPRDFAVATAIGDSLTAALAVSAFVALLGGWRAAIALAWLCTIVGSGDLVIALSHASRIEAQQYMAAQWYVPVLAGPLMLVSHVAAVVALLRHRAGNQRRS